jgi:thiol-disulfide isomerase/thioredoxin
MPVPGLVALVGALAAACVVALWLRRAPRRLQSAPSPSPRASDVELLGTSELGAELGERATLVQFSTAFCQPCRATRRILDDVARAVPGVAHIEVDAESHLELVRRLDIRRTPTVLVLDEAGRVVRRASGQPRKVDVLQALDAAVS